MTCKMHVHEIYWRDDDDDDDDDEEERNKRFYGFVSSTLWIVRIAEAKAEAATSCLRGQRRSKRNEMKSKKVSYSALMNSNVKHKNAIKIQRSNGIVDLIRFGWFGAAVAIRRFKLAC